MVRGGSVELIVSLLREDLEAHLLVTSSQLHITLKVDALIVCMKGLRQHIFETIRWNRKVSIERTGEEIFSTFEEGRKSLSVRKNREKLFDERNSEGVAC